MEDVFEINPYNKELSSYRFNWDGHISNRYIMYDKLGSDFKSLYHVIIPEGVKIIGENVFAKCDRIGKVTIPESVKEIKKEAFRGCSQLEQLVINSKYVEISSSAFCECNNIKKIIVADIYNFSVNDLLLTFSDCISNLEEIVSTNINEKKEIIPINLLKEYNNRLFMMAAYYNTMGMNITSIQGHINCTLEDNNKNSFKEPVGGKKCMIRNLYNKNQTIIELCNIKWEQCTGLGVALGHNKIRAIDVDGTSHYDQNETIQRFLNVLGLPEDYQWVVVSGSGAGFHIIIEADDIEENFDSVAFIPNDDNIDRWEGPLFERLELRWRDHLVLPPSIHFSGNNYHFLNELIPKTPIQKLPIANISNMINHFCGEIEFEEYREGEIVCEIVNLTKIYCECSWSFKYETKVYQKAPISWLIACQTPEAYNSLAIRYLKGDGVEVDKEKAFELFKKAGDYSLAIFNISSLIAYGVLEGTKDDKELYIYNLLHTCVLDHIEFDDKIDRIINQIQSPLQKKELYLFFDTETTGLPLDYNASSADVNNWPRLVQLSWILMSDKEDVISKESFIIKPNRFVIPTEASNIHHITNEIAIEQGEDLKFVLEKFLADFKQAKYVVGHNVDFDKKIVGAELIRTSLHDTMGTKPSYCTMKNTIHYCKIPYKAGQYKYPKLQELFFKLFGNHFENEHNAASDVEATQKCFWALREKGLI